MPISATGNSPATAEHGFTRLWRSAEHGFTRLLRSAERGFTRLWHSAEHGFTLLELLVVLALIGIMSAVVMVSAPDARGRLIDEAEQFAARASAARDSAIISSRATRLTTAASGYGFEQRRGGNWVGMAERPLAPANWQAGTSATAARIEFDPTGLATPGGRVILQRGDEQVAISIGADGVVHVAR